MIIDYFSFKLTCHDSNGSEFMKQNQDAFSLIIINFSDPMGFAESPCKVSNYQLMKQHSGKTASFTARASASDCTWTSSKKIGTSANP